MFGWAGHRCPQWEVLEVLEVRPELGWDGVLYRAIQTIGARPFGCDCSRASCDRLYRNLPHMLDVLPWLLAFLRIPRMEVALLVG